MSAEGSRTSSWRTWESNPTAESTPSPWSSAGRSSDMSLTSGSLVAVGEASSGRRGEVLLRR
jgi:hypothetical protein